MENKRHTMSDDDSSDLRHLPRRGWKVKEGPFGRFTYSGIGDRVRSSDFSIVCVTVLMLLAPSIYYMIAV